MSNKPIDLAQFDNSFRQEKTQEAGDYDAVPDGKYQVTVEKVELTEARSTGNPMIKWKLRIIAPQQVNRILWRNSVITNKTLKFIKTDLHICGLDLETFSELPNHLSKLLDVKLEVTKRTKGENENIFFNQRISGGNRGNQFREEASDSLVPF